MFEIVSTWSEVQSKIIQPYTENKKHIICPIKKEDIHNKIYQEIFKRLGYRFYRSMDDLSVIHTIEYVFYKIRSGIFVEIRNNQLFSFIPFANKYFQNNWSNNIRLYGSKNNTVKEYIQHKKKYFRYTYKYIFNPKYWWANAYIINNEVREDIWGQHSLQEFFDLLQTTLQNNKIGDCVFIINKRDHPLMHKKLLEPYPSLYPSPKHIEKKYSHSSYIPILSPYTNENYTDIPFVIAEDWKLANQDPSYYKIEHDVSWSEKIPTAFFRGSATGSMEIQYNQRLMITKLDYEWSKSKPTLLDAGIVSWNSRDKIDSSLQINYIKPKEMNRMGIYLKPKVPMNEQIKYKYIINIDGHSKPNRTMYLLQSGSLMFIVESKFVIGNTCWYSHMLIPFKHYIPIKHDLSDLEEKIIWCRNNDEQCKTMVENSIQLFHTLCSKKNIMNYTSVILNTISTQIKKN